MSYRVPSLSSGAMKPLRCFATGLQRVRLDFRLTDDTRRSDRDLQTAGRSPLAIELAGRAAVRPMTLDEIIDGFCVTGSRC